MQTTTAGDTGVSTHFNPDPYSVLLARVQEAFTAAVADDEVMLFTTDATDLAARFIAALPADQQQIHTCNTCRRFFEAYGGLVVVDTEGMRTPLLWNHIPVAIPEMYRAAIQAVHRAVAMRPITGVVPLDLSPADGVQNLPSTSGHFELFEEQGVNLLPRAKVPVKI